MMPRETLRIVAPAKSTNSSPILADQREFEQIDIHTARRGEKGGA
jgi:hypothetical protein